MITIYGWSTRTRKPTGQRQSQRTARRHHPRATVIVGTLAALLPVGQTPALTTPRPIADDTYPPYTGPLERTRSFQSTKPCLHHDHNDDHDHDHDHDHERERERDAGPSSSPPF